MRLPQPIHAITAFIAIAISTVTAAAELDIRDDTGRVVIAAEDIKSYDGQTHTFTLTPGMRPRLSDSLRKNGSLVSGIPFTICLGGKPIYQGTFTTSASSFSFPTPVIVVNPIARNAQCCTTTSASSSATPPMSSSKAMIHAATSASK
jgi:hypothetical protein